MSTTRRATALLVVLGLALAGCGGSSGPDPETTGPAARATKALIGYGLTRDEATCMVDALGADVVNEAADLTALTEGGAYQDAAGRCLDDQ